MTPEQEAEIVAYREQLQQGEPSDELSDEQVWERLQFERSRTWLENTASERSMSLKELLEAAHGYLSTGNFYGLYNIDLTEEFWDHFSRVTYRPYEENFRNNRDDDYYECASCYGGG